MASAPVATVLAARIRQWAVVSGVMIAVVAKFGATLEVVSRIRLRWAVVFLSALAALDLSVFALDSDSTALSMEVDPQVTYAPCRGRYCLLWIWK